MSFFQKLFGNKPEAKDEIAPICPSCGFKLEKAPGKKTACPSCKEFMYVRTRPTDRKRVLVTKAQADEIDEQWTIVSGTHEQFLANKKELQDEYELLRKRFGKEPSDNDVKWSLLNKRLIAEASKNKWGLYRNTRLEMGDVLRKEEKYKHALSTYLEICYLDLNGPTNSGGIPFDPSYPTAQLAPGIVEYIKKLMKRLNLDITEVKKLFLFESEKVRKNLHLPLSPEDCWKKLEEGINSDMIAELKHQLSQVNS